MASRRRIRSGRVSATQAARNFGQLVDRVREEQATYIVDRGGVPVARISPAGPAACTLHDLVDLLRNRRPLGEEYGRVVESAVAHHNELRARRNPWAR
jgi:prevent-host-death family protein